LSPSPEDVSIKDIKKLTPTKHHILQCVCNKEVKRVNLKALIICSHCNTAQHVKCVFTREVRDEEKNTYLCPLCWKSTNKIVEVSSTIIVAPASIKNQWKSEIHRHVKNENFKVLLYNGISNGWISPDELGTYDCVITDFNTLSKELYFTNTYDRDLRQSKKYPNPQSPLILTKWWRVILDEAQMVENCQARPSQMVAQLSTNYCWSSTGTPIERGSIFNLHGIISFLRVDPVLDKLQSVRKFCFDQNFIDMISKVMWRTCKKDVEHEIEIPPQKEIVHYVDMSELQKCFYKQVHQSTKQDFLMRLERYQKNQLVFKNDKSTIKTLLEPLRKIRQDCTIANLFINVNDQTRVKQTLRAVSFKFL
jgi:E3 ubiquitin-protein ligase SHPRH